MSTRKKSISFLVGILLSLSFSARGADKDLVLTIKGLMPNRTPIIEAFKSFDDKYKSLEQKEFSYWAGILYESYNAKSTGELLSALIAPGDVIFNSTMANQQTREEWLRFKKFVEQMQKQTRERKVPNISDIGIDFVGYTDQLRSVVFEFFYESGLERMRFALAFRLEGRALVLAPLARSQSQLLSATIRHETRVSDHPDSL